MFNWSEHCVAVIPCFNEAARVASVVKGLRRHLAHVIVVDDGSTDDTSGQAERAGAVVVRLGRNGGKGAALRAGWSAAQARGFSWALSLDGDGQHAADDVPEFFARAEQTSARLVVGNRMTQAEGMPLVRRWANRWMSRCLSDMTGAVLPDSQCGFRLAHLETVLRLGLRARRFEIESEMLVAFLAAGERVEFVPVQVIYESRRSHICPWRDTWRWLRWRAAQEGAR